MSVGWLDCVQDYAKTAACISAKLGRWIGTEPRKYLFNFGRDPGISLQSQT